MRSLSPTSGAETEDSSRRPLQDMAAMLARFVRRSLLEREGAERFKLHDLAADYARAQRAGAGPR